MKKDNTNKIEDYEARIGELENNWKRALADYQNLQKRTMEERGEIVKFANETLIRRLLFVLENLDYLTEHINDTGLKLIFKEFKQTLEDEGVEEINAVDSPFDPSVMEAIEKITTEDKQKDNMVLEVVQKGYKLKNKVLRPTRVKVGHFVEQNEEKE